MNYFIQKATIYVCVCVYIQKIKRPRNFWVEIELVFDYFNISLFSKGGSVWWWGSVVWFNASVRPKPVMKGT